MAKLYKDKVSLHDFDVGLIEKFEKNIRQVLDWTSEQSRNLWLNTVRDFERKGKELPLLVRVLDDEKGDANFRRSVEYDRSFAGRAGLVRGCFEKEDWDYVRAGVALMYYDLNTQEMIGLRKRFL